MPESPDPYAKILTELQTVGRRLDRIERALTPASVAAPFAGRNLPPGAPTPGDVADDADLDSQWGDPQVRKDPPRWTGQSYAGVRYSDCPPEYLDTLAGFLDWQANKADEKNEMANNGKPRSMYLRKDAGRCRGWAARIRAKAAQHQRPAHKPPQSMNEPDDSDIPF